MSALTTTKFKNKKISNNACTACDPECDCIELDNHRNGECDTNCQFCESENK